MLLQTFVNDKFALIFGTFFDETNLEPKDFLPEGYFQYLL